MNDKNFPPFDDAVLKSLAGKVADNRADLISRYQQALRETLFTNRSIMHPGELARVAEREADALISSLRNSLSSTRAQGAALSEMGLSRQAFFSLLLAMREFFIAHFENDFTALNIYTLYRIMAIEGYLDSNEKRILVEQEGIRRAFQIAMDRSLEKIRESEERYRSLVEISPDAVALLDLHGNIIMMNKAGAELLKYETTEEMVGKNMVSLIAPDEQAKARNAFREMLEKSIGSDREFLVVRKDGTLFDAEFSGVVIFDADGNAQSIMLVGRDITLHKQTERLLSERVMEATAELRKASERLEELVTRSPTIIYAAQLEDTYPTSFITGNVYDQLGYSSEQFITDPDFVFSHIHPQDVERVRAELGRIFDNEQAVLEYRFRHRNGEYRWMRDALRLIRSPKGQPLEIVGSRIDITERKQAEDALRAAETDYRAIFERAPVGIFRSTVEGHFIKVNQLAAEMYGYCSPEEMIREIESIDTQIYADTSRRSEFHNLLAENGEVQDFISQDRRRDGSIFWTSANARIVKNEIGEILYYEGFIEDITERKHVEDNLATARESLRLANLGLQQALENEQRISRTDSLTEAHNRRYFFEFADYEFSIAKRYGKSLSMIMFDIDHFKQFNDSYGHQAGDEILKQVTQIARQQLRDADIFARYGGEEFVILLPNTDMSKSTIVAKRIRESVAAYQLDVRGNKISVTVSVGVAEQFASTDTLDQLVQQADKAMYAAKDAGRNCVMVYSL